MEFSDILEKWASAHPEIKHVKAKDSKNKRVFYTKGFADMADSKNKPLCHYGEQCSCKWKWWRLGI